MVYHDVLPNLDAHISVDVLLLRSNINKVIVTLDVNTLIAATTLRFFGCCRFVSSKRNMYNQPNYAIHPLGRPLFFGAFNFIAPWPYRNTHDSLALSPAGGASEKITSLGDLSMRDVAT